ncbi:Intraflagellar transport protein 88-like [Papilio machaon]|uniref:Intraflagellar transport protein 88-like n=1 Tax=Papilio machaon TaxID=76193 RepID=A0A194RHQ7_PAPMA|nr:Intraflagellar transport protein 88-like [Papilio machaon]
MTKVKNFKYKYEVAEAVWPSEVTALQWLAGDADPDEALRYYRRAARLQPHNPQWGLLMGGCLRASGKYQEALALYKKLNARFPDNVQCLKLIVKLCGDQGLSETSAWTRELQRAQARLKQQERAVLSTSSGSGSSGASHSPSDLATATTGGSRAEKRTMSRQSSDGRGDSAVVHSQQYGNENQESGQAIGRSVNRPVSRRKTEEFDDDLPLPPE